MSKLYCVFCHKKIGLFFPKATGASQDGLCLCKKCYSTYWKKQKNSVSQAKQLSKRISNGDLKPEIKKIVVKRINELIYAETTEEKSTIGFNDLDRESNDFEITKDNTIPLKKFNPNGSKEENSAEPKLDEAPFLSSEGSSNEHSSISNDYSVETIAESKEISILSMNIESETIVKPKRTSFLYEKKFVIGRLEIDNPCIYISDDGFSFAINSKVLPTTITMSVETDHVGERSLDKKGLFFFDGIELSYFLLWLANYKNYDFFPPHCYSRFFDGIFHRALVERKNQLSIIQKTIAIVNYSQSMELNVQLLRFVFAVLTDYKHEISFEDKTDICKKLENHFNFRFYFLKPGWDWDPISWYLESGMGKYIPSSLLTNQKMATAGIKASNRGIILTKAYSKCISFLKGEKIKYGLPYLLNSYTERVVKNYHKEVYTYKTRNWAFEGADNKTEPQTLFDDMEEYIKSDWHHAKLVNSIEEPPLVELWIAMPPKYQQAIAELFRLEIEPYFDKEITIRTLFSIFNKTYPDKTKTIRVIGNYYLSYIQRCLGYLGYSIVLSIPIENANLDTLIWIVQNDKASEKLKELIDKSDDSLFIVNKKGRIVGISPKVYTLETVYIPSEIDDKLINEIGSGVFANAKNMKHLIINKGVKVIRKSAFSNCKNLELIELPDTLVELENNAFSGCNSLIYFKSPKNVEKIGDCVFRQCSSLEKFEFNGKVKSVGYQMFCDCHSLKEIILPSLIKSIPLMFFYTCKSLESIIIPSHIEMIESTAFANCEKLKSVFFENNSCAIGLSAFENCISLTNISLPKKMKVIENETFKNCTGLKAMEIPEGIHHIGSRAFSYCEKLETIIFHNEECTFDDFVFLDCISLTSIILPKTTYGKLSSIFHGCKNLKHIVAPRNIEIGDYFSYLVNSDVDVQFYD